VHEPEVEEPAARAGCPAAEPAVDGCGRHLDEDVCPHERLEKHRSFLHVEVPLGMREDRLEALDPQPEESIGQIERPADVGGFHEERSSTAEAEAHELIDRAIELSHVELSARDHRDRRAGSQELGERGLHLFGCSRVVDGADVRCRRQNLDAVGGNGRTQLERLLERCRAVVEPREHMAVEIDQRGNRRSGTAWVIARV